MMKRLMFAALLITGLGDVALAGDGVGDGAADPDHTVAQATPPPSAGPAAPAPAPAPAPAATTDPAAAPAAPAAAPPAAKPPAITGFIDTTYNYNLNRPANGTNPFLFYDTQHNSLALNAAHLSISGDADPSLSYVVDIDAGSDAVANASNFAPGGGAYKFDIQEAYGVYKRDKFGIRIGKFATFNGIEVIESGPNPTVSRGFLFGLAEPVTNTGFEAFYQATDKVDVHLGLLNGWDLVLDNNRGKTIVAKVGIVPAEGDVVTISAYAGPEQAGNDSNWRETLDVTALVKLGKLDLNLQGNVGREDAAVPGGDATWFGVGVQPVFHVSDVFSLAGRIEYFNDNDGARTGGKVQLTNITVTPGYQLSPHFLVRADARLDIADQEVYQGSDGAGSKTEVLLLGEAIASF
jgi:hypothetical protein